MMTVMNRSDTLKQLTGVYGMRQEHAVRALAVADQLGLTAEATANGTVTIRARHNGREQFEVSDGIPAEAAEGRGPKAGYNQSKKAAPKGNNNKGRQTMPRGTKEAKTAEQNGEVDYTVYADKPITATMVDFHEWLEEVTGTKLDLRSVALGGTLRMDFQRSDFNRGNREARREERQAEAERAKGERAEAKAAKAEATKAEPAKAKPGPKPAARRGAAKPMAAPKRGRGRPAAASAPF